MNTYLLTMLLLALMSGIVLRRLRSRTGEKLDGDVQRVIARLSWILLAVFSVDAVSKSATNFWYVLGMLLYILMVYLLARAIDRRPQSTVSVIPIASTTFGGGNRGVAMVMALSALPILLNQREDLLAVFVQLDAAVIVWLVVITPYLLAISTGEKPSVIDSYKSLVSEAGFAPVVMVLVVLFGWAAPDGLKSWLRDTLAHSRAERAAVLMYLSFTLMFTNASLADRSLGSLLNDLLRFYLPRILPVMAIALFVYLINQGDGTVLTASSSSLFIALCVLALSPPSSLFAVLLERELIPSQEVRRLADLSLVTTALFLALATLAASPALLQKLLSALLSA